MTSKHDHKRYYCLNCLSGFNSQDRLDLHSGTCSEINGTQKIIMPRRGDKAKFGNYRKQLPAQFVIYADFESLLIPEEGEGKCLRKTQRHELCSYGFKRVCHYDNKYSGEYKSYRGPGAVRRFLKELLEEVKMCNLIVQEKFVKPVVMCVNDFDTYENEVVCHICDGVFTEADPKVLDHCHITGKYRGAAHNSCNLNVKLTGKIPVVFHNLRGYDSHFIMQEVNGLDESINVIVNNMEKYMSFTIGKQLVCAQTVPSPPWWKDNSLRPIVTNAVQ